MTGERNRPAPPVRARALVAVGTGDTISGALNVALKEARIKAALPQVLSGSPKVVVRPVLPPGSQKQDLPVAYVTPALVESLLAWLHALGYEDVKVAVPCSESVTTAADVGYATEVVNMANDSRPFHYGGLIGEHVVSRSWLDADVRIVVAKAHTDRQVMFAGSIIGALGCIPNSDELASRLVTSYELAQCANDILQKLPITVGIVDGWYSADDQTGRDGSGVRQTGSVLASADLLALDWVLGELMGLDSPELNPVVREALTRRGVVDISRRGNLTPWNPWRNPSANRAALTEIGAGQPWARLTGSREVAWTAR